LQDEVYQIVGCAREVLNTLGPGFLEKPDEKVIVETKTLEKITHLERGEVINYFICI